MKKPFPQVPVEQLAEILRHAPARTIAEWMLALASDHPEVAASIAEVVSDFRQSRERDLVARLRAAGMLQ